MTDDLEIKIAIAQMYYHMGRTCKRTSSAIEKDLDRYNIKTTKIGYEVVTDNKKYQLVLELKEIPEWVIFILN